MLTARHRRLTPNRDLGRWPDGQHGPTTRTNPSKNHCTAPAALLIQIFAFSDQIQANSVAREIRCSEVPRYYFHIRRGRATILDHEGTDLANDQEAAREARRLGREIAKAHGLNGYPLTSKTQSPRTDSDPIPHSQDSPAAFAGGQ
jgi:hypothetical protein